MKKFLLAIMALPLLWGMAACSDNEGSEPDPDETEQPVQPAEPEGPRDLSADGMANCYIVQQAGEYKFKADNQFNLGEGLPVPPAISVESVRLLWQSAKGLITSVSLDKEGETPYVCFTVSEPRGNALIAVADSEGTIQWSWHIWMPETEISSVATTNGYEVMNINLGAISNTPSEADSYGMLYQWGRKDPFPAAATLTGDTSTLPATVYDIEGNPVSISNSDWRSDADNTLAFATANPTVVISNMSHFSTTRDWLKADAADNALWGNPDGDKRDPETNAYVNKGRKTCYDPSPAGWRIGPADVFNSFTATGGYAWEFEDFNIDDANRDGVLDINDYYYGWHFMMAGGNALYFPAAARYDGSYAMLMGSMSGLWGNYWSNAPYSSTPGCGFCGLSFQVKTNTGQEMITISPSGGSSKADAFSVRCIRE